MRVLRRPEFVVVSPLLAGVMFGCAGPDDTGEDSDSASSDTADSGSTDSGTTDTGPACDGTRVITFEDMPDSITEFGDAWASNGIQWTAESYNGPIVLLKDEDDCLVARSGAIRGGLVETGCGGKAARFTVQSNCGATGAGCTEVIVGTYQDGPVAKNEPSSKDEATLPVAPQDGFSLVAFRSLDGRLCRIEVDETPLTEALEPLDTGDPF